MFGKEKRIEKENKLLLRIYDLILNKQTNEDERTILIEFKNSVESGKDFELETMKLAETLRLLGLKKFNNNDQLTPDVGKLYTDIFSTGLLKKELGRGIVALSFLANIH